MEKILIDGRHLTIEDVVAVARNGAQVGLTDEAVKAIVKARKLVDRFVEEKQVVYGITTGFGKFSDTVISKEETGDLQRNLIISHACGVGDPFDEEVVRAVMLLRANALAQGHSGIRLETLERLIAMLNAGVHPVIPEKGSLGASGDLAPLAHMVLVLIGEGEAFFRGERLQGPEAMRRAGIEPIALTSKEGLALINGTQVMTAVGALATHDALRLSALTDVTASLTLEALGGIIDAFDERLHLVRPHPGQIKTAANVRKLTKGSKLVTHQGERRVQDAYALRCIPQIHGASKDALAHVKEKVEIEINAVTDNPILFPDEGIAFSGGNFHGQPMALAFDYLGIALAELANATERRIERLVNPALSGLPAFLTKHGGLHSGFMIAQYAAAALVSENKVLAHPASVDSIPSSANQEDHVSMGTIAARKAAEILENVEHVVAIEYFAACQALDFAPSVEPGGGTRVAYDALRAVVPFVDEDRVMHVDFQAARELLRSEDLLEKIEEASGALARS